MRKEGHLLLGVFLLSCVMIGCAKTPEKEIIVQKDQEQLIQTANSLQNKSTTIQEQVQAPAKFQESYTFSKGKNKVNIDAAVVLPKAKQAKIIRVKRDTFSTKMVENWTKVLFSEQKLYDPETMITKTKDELQADILALKQQIALMDDKENTVVAQEQAAEGGEITEYTKKDVTEEHIKFLQEQLADAPEERVFLEKTAEEVQKEIENLQENGWIQIAGLQEQQAKGNEQMYDLLWTTVSAEASATYIGDIRIGNQPSFAMINTEENLVSTEEGEKMWNEAEDLSMTKEEAIEQADVFLTQMGLTDFYLARASKGFDTTRDDEIQIEGYKAWWLEYRRMVEQMPVSWTLAMGAYPEEGEWWNYEKLDVLIRDDGITRWSYEAPYTLGEVLCENCQLLPFETIMEIGEKMFQNYEGAGEGDIFMERDIDRITFGYTRITEENMKHSGLLVPTWTFYGTYSQMRKNDGAQHSFRAENMEQLIINAIDGSVINPDVGY